MGGISAISCSLMQYCFSCRRKSWKICALCGLNLYKFLLSEGVSVLTVNTFLLNAAGYSILIYVYLHNLACGVNAALGGCQTPVCLCFLLLSETGIKESGAQLRRALYNEICFLNWHLFMRQLTRQPAKTFVLYPSHMYPCLLLFLWWIGVFSLKLVCKTNSLKSFPKAFQHSGVWSFVCLKSNQIFLCFYSQFALTVMLNETREKWQSPKLGA